MPIIVQTSPDNSSPSSFVIKSRHQSDNLSQKDFLSFVVMLGGVLPGTKSTSIGCFVIMPMLIGLLFVAEPFVKVVLTDKWIPSIKYLQILSLAYLTYPINSSNLTAIKSIGRSDVYMKLEIVRRILKMLILRLRKIMKHYFYFIIT